jgi:hypothetical protein
MAEYIEREDFVKWLEEMQIKHPKKADAFGVAKIHLRHVPAADVKPVVHGRNISDEAHGHIEFKCSLCGCELSTVYGGKNDCGMDGGYFNYCPHCGARMDGEK